MAAGLGLGAGPTWEVTSCGGSVPPPQVAKYVWHRRDLLALNLSRVDFLLGESRGAPRPPAPQGCGGDPQGCRGDPSGMGFLPLPGM